RHGRSGKGGKSGGRWGLGKLVFSSSSLSRAFFGYTVRDSDKKALLMGQAVLSNHEIDGRRYPAHGFWFEGRVPETKLQLPVTDISTIKAMQDLLGLTRIDQAGLSIAIPYVNGAITETKITTSVISNYYFPILSGRLSVEVGSKIINKDTFHKIATSEQEGSGSSIPFNFVEQVSAGMAKAPDLIASKPIGGSPLDDTFFAVADLQAIKQRFASGEMIHVQIPVRLRPKGEADTTSSVDLFLKAPQEEGQSFALVARGPITLIGERRYFSGRPAHAALVAHEEKIAAFLGDAENPAHTAWNSNAEKLAARWRTPAATISNIRNSLRILYDMVAARMETEHPDALIDFFSLVDHSQSQKGKKKPVKPPKPPVISPREKAILIRARKGGFEIAAGPGATRWEFPRRIRVRMAYDIIGGDPFARHSRFDFDLTKKEIDLTTDSAEMEPVGKNVLVLNVHSPAFRLEASGFDERRDIIVDARVLP
ncbi:MAG: hypothetical protein AB7F09_18065, partial [Parvibaculaceae bacterium]